MDLSGELGFEEGGVHLTGSLSFIMAAFGISSAEPLGSATAVSHSDGLNLITRC